MRGQMTHPDTDVLAEFHAGLITGRRGAHIAGHLASCERCTTLSGQLADVSALLAAVPAPAMPQSVAHRLDTVLAAEVAKKNYPERADGDSSREGGSRHRLAGSRGFRLLTLRVLAPAAAILVLAATGYGLSRIGGGPASQTASGSAAAPVPRNTGGHAAAPIGEHQGLSRGPQFTFPVVTSDTNYQPATLRQQLTAEVLASPAAGTGKTPSGTLIGCVHRVTGGARPVLVESARFRGQPATIIVVSKSSGDLVWVVGAGCSPSNSDPLYSTTLPPGI